MSTNSLRQRTGVTLQRLCLAIFLALFAPASLSTARADVGSTRASAIAVVGHAPLGWTWNRLFSPFQRILGDQKAMIRFGTVAFISALYIIWWRK